MNKDLTVGKPEAVLIRFALPLFGSVIFQQLYNIADSFVAGRYAGANALAGWLERRRDFVRDFQCGTDAQIPKTKSINFFPKSGHT